ncbi:MAG TPA: hypothetical protein VIC27_05215 [Ktedonobacterales bacterium]
MADSEAQRIVDDLVNSLGMQGAAIAREIGVKADTITNIRRRHSSGNLYTPRLRILRDQLANAAGHRPTLPRADVPTQTVIDQLPSVNDMLSPVSEAPEPASINLNADEPAPAEPKTLKDRASDWLRAAMLGESPQPSLPSMSAPSRKKKNDAASVEQGDLIEQLVPLAALLFVLTGSVLIPDPYKPCGPNQAEASAIAYPIVKRAVRELDARKRLSEATMDAVAILLAVGAYGVRAHQTYQQIHAVQAEEAQRARSDRPSSGAEFLAASGGGPRGNAAAASADAGAGRGIPDGGAPLPFWRGNAGRAREAVGAAGREPRGEPTGPEQRRADASIDALLAADHAGRLRLGL